MKEVGTCTAIAMLAVFLSACAGIEAVNVHTVDKKEVDGSGNPILGFRYYDSAPYLFVHSDGKGGITGEIVWLPDTSVMRSIRPYAYLASNDVTIKFANGTLSEASANVDETVVVNALLNAVTKTLPFVPFATQQSSGGVSCQIKAPLPYLYRIKIIGDSITLTGGPPLQPSCIDATAHPDQH